MIGLVDYDLQTSESKNLTPPNLEIMKLATYYKTEHNLFCRLVPLDETTIGDYEKIYFFSEKDNPPQIPPQFLSCKNLILGGTAFTNRIYKPFSESLIDYTIPRIAIYQEFLKQKYQDGIKTKIISHILDDTYYRFKAGDNALPLPAILPNKRVILYDRDFFTQGWEQIIDRISSRKPSTIVTLHPIYCKTLSQYFAIRQKEKISRQNNIILDTNIPLEDVNYMLNKYKKIFLADITKSTNTSITLGGTFVSNFQYYKDFIYKMNLLYSFWSQNIPLKLYYDEPLIGAVDPLSTLAKKVVSWANNASVNHDKTLNDRIIFKTKQSKMEEEKILLLKFYPKAADLFMQSYDDLSRRGVWRI